MTGFGGCGGALAAWDRCGQGSGTGSPCLGGGGRRCQYRGGGNDIYARGNLFTAASRLCQDQTVEPGGGLGHAVGGNRDGFLGQLPGCHSLFDGAALLNDPQHFQSGRAWLGQTAGGVQAGIAHGLVIHLGQNSEAVKNLSCLTLILCGAVFGGVTFEIFRHGKRPWRILVS